MEHDIRDMIIKNQAKQLEELRKPKTIGIAMLPYTSNHMIPLEGKYLIRTESKINPKHFEMFTTACHFKHDKNGVVVGTAVSASTTYREITHISAIPVY